MENIQDILEAAKDTPVANQMTAAIKLLEREFGKAEKIIQTKDTKGRIGYTLQV